MDIALSLFGLAAGVFLFIGIYIALKLSSPGPIFFAHERVGFDGKRFRCLKLRTMHLGADKILERHLDENPEARLEYLRTQKLKNDPRVIPGIGTFLRQSSFDELPQFLNVLKGEMSVIGPRPVTIEELPRYGRHVPAYLASRPGISGLWQVSGRNDVTYSRRAALDGYYARSWSILLDIWIVFRTVVVIINHRGAY